MKILLEIVLLPFAAYLALSSVYQMILAIAAQTKSKRPLSNKYGYSKFLVLVPAYKEDAVIKYSTTRNMFQRYEYPREQFDLVIIGDQLREQTKSELKQMGAIVHSVNFEKSTKVKSLQSAISKFNSGYDAVVILDADNIMEKGFLFKSNQWIQSGTRAIQGLRKAANSNTSTALMDGLSEMANTEMLCKGANQLGFSSKLSGSAMVFNFELFKKVILQWEAIGGFDKEMELLLTKQNEFIQYTPDLAVLDQKVTSTEAFTKQRGRWIEAQYTFFKKSFVESFKLLVNGNLDFFHKVLQLALPPRAIAPFAMLLLALLGLVMHSQIILFINVIGFISLALAYLMVLPFKTLLKESFRICISIPQIGWAAVRAMMLMGKSKKEFIHTQHELIKA